MATAAEAIEQIAAKTGMLPATVFRAARALREADLRLWPQGTAGRGKAAQVEASHLVNLVLALAVADPITAAPEVAPQYCALRRHHRSVTIFSTSEVGERISHSR